MYYYMHNVINEGFEIWGIPLTGWYQIFILDIILHALVYPVKDSCVLQVVYVLYKYKTLPNYATICWMSI